MVKFIKCGIWLTPSIILTVSSVMRGATEGMLIGIVSGLILWRLCRLERKLENCCWY
jgi:hypothetical protein